MPRDMRKIPAAKAGNMAIPFQSDVSSEFIAKIRRSWAFDPPEAGKIAIRVINHCGDEVLKVYDAHGGWPIHPDFYNELKEFYHQDP